MPVQSDKLRYDLLGRDTMWDEFPDWRGTYGFAVRRSPYTGSSELHVDRNTGGAARGVVRYQSGPEPPPLLPPQRGVRGLLSRLLRWRAPRPHPVYFTSFLWYDRQGCTHECTREELCTAFRRLVADWQELFTLACAVWSAWGAAFLDAEKQPLACGSDEALRRENELYSRIEPSIQRWSKFGTRLWYEADLFAQHLSDFTWLEWEKTAPRAFSHYPGTIGHDLGQHFSDKVRMWYLNGQTDDWVLRYAQLINRHEAGEWARLHGINTMKELLVQLRTDVLNAKGYAGEKEGERHLDAVTGRRHPFPKQG